MKTGSDRVPLVGPDLQGNTDGRVLCCWRFVRGVLLLDQPKLHQIGNRR